MKEADENLESKTEVKNVIGKCHFGVNGKQNY